MSLRETTKAQGTAGHSWHSFVCTSLMLLLIFGFQLINGMNIFEISTFLFIYSIFLRTDSSLDHGSALHVAGSQIIVQGHYWIKATMTSEKHSHL